MAASSRKVTRLTVSAFTKALALQGIALRIGSLLARLSA